MNLYRVEKDGKTFYIQPDMLEYYADNGYDIYKPLEEKVTDVAEEISIVEEEYGPVTPPTE